MPKQLDEWSPITKMGKIREGGHWGPEGGGVADQLFS